MVIGNRGIGSSGVFFNEALFDILPNEQGPTHVGIEGADHPKLWNLNTVI